MAGKQISGAASLDHGGFEQSIGLAQTSLRKVMGFSDGRTAAETLAARLRGAQSSSESAKDRTVSTPVEATPQQAAAKGYMPTVHGRPERVPGNMPATVVPADQTPPWWAGDLALEVEEISITAPDELSARGGGARSEASAQTSEALRAGNLDRAPDTWERDAEQTPGLSQDQARRSYRASRADTARPGSKGIRLGWLLITLAGLLAVALLAWR